MSKFESQLQRALKLKPIVDGSVSASENERENARELLDRIYKSNPVIRVKLASMEKTPLKQINFKCSSDQEVMILSILCEAYNVQLYKYGRQYRKRHIRCPRDIAEMIRIEFEELISRWRNILQGALWGFISTHIEFTPGENAKDISEVPPELREAYINISQAFYGQPKKGLNIKRIPD